MKVVLVGSAHPLRGGLAAYNERLAKQLQDEGHEVIIYTFSLQYPAILFPGTSQYSDEPAPSNLQIKVKVNSINPFNWFMVGMELRKINPDLVLFKFWLPFMGPCFGTLARLVKWGKNARVISILDNVIPHEHRFGDYWFTRYFIQPVDGFIAMSDSVMYDLKKFTSTKPCLLIPHPVYDNFGEIISKGEARKKLGIQLGEKVLLFFGFIRGYKGLDILLNAMADPNIVNSKIKLLVAGEFYEDRTVYDQIIAKHHLADKLYLHTDYIPNIEVKNYFCAADVVVQPYKTATQSGISQMAYHFERPMIVTRIGGLPEIVPHGKVGYVTDIAPQAIADAVIQFFDSKQNWLDGIREEKKKYAWQNISHGIMELMKMGS